MSRAEERALEAYPVLFSERRGYDNTFKDRRESYIKGYHQAEKDLKLSWEDIENIITISYKLDKEEEISGKYAKLMTHYQEVLKRFKEKRMNYDKGTST